MSAKKTSPHPLHRVPLEAWRELYHLAFQIGELKPWELLNELDIMGIQPIGAAEPLYASIMGKMGEFHGIDFYIGNRAIAQYWQMREDDHCPEMNISVLLNIPQFKVSYGSAAETHPEEKKLIRKLGHSPRGALAWPTLQSVRPGYAPWFLIDDEIEQLRGALAKLLELLIYCEREQELPETVTPFGTYQVYVEDPAAPGTWTLQPVRLPSFEVTRFTLDVPGDLMDKLAAIEQNQMELELDLQVFPFLMGEENQRPELPHVLMIVEGRSYFVLCTEVIHTTEGIELLYAEVPEKFLRTLEKHNIRPQTIHFTNPYLLQLLQEPCEILNIELLLTDELPALDDALQNLMEYFG